MDDKEAIAAKGNEMIATIQAAMNGVSQDPNIQLNALATLYVNVCFFGGLGINETAGGVTRVYQNMLENLRPKALEPAPVPETFDVAPVETNKE